MKRFTRVLAVTAMCAPIHFAMTHAALAETSEGEGDSHTKTTDMHGTTTKTDTSKSDKVGILGTRTIEAEGKVTTDPKGLGNKTEETVAKETTIGKDGDRKDKMVEVDAAGTKTTVAREVESHGNLTGGTTTTKKSMESVDPKGMMNKSTMETEQKTVQKDGVATTTTTKKLDGDVVSSETHTKP